MRQASGVGPSSRPAKVWTKAGCYWLMVSLESYCDLSTMMGRASWFGRSSSGNRRPWLLKTANFPRTVGKPLLTKKTRPAVSPLRVRELGLVGTWRAGLPLPVKQLATVLRLSDQGREQLLSRPLGANRAVKRFRT